MAVSTIKQNTAFRSFGPEVNLASYTSTNYTCPSDGYAKADCGAAGAAKSIIQITDGTYTVRLGGWGNNSYPYWSTFVKKGMQLRVITLEGGGKAAFTPFA